MRTAHSAFHVVLLTSIVACGIMQHCAMMRGSLQDATKDQWSLYAGKGSGVTLMEWHKIAATNYGFLFATNRMPTRCVLAIEPDPSCQHLLKSFRRISNDGICDNFLECRRSLPGYSNRLNCVTVAMTRQGRRWSTSEYQMASNGSVHAPILSDTHKLLLSMRT